MLEPYEVAFATSKLIVPLVPKYLDQEAIHCVTAMPKEMAYVRNHPF
jgi:hypothetical protein